MVSSSRGCAALRFWRFVARGRGAVPRSGATQEDNLTGLPCPINLEVIQADPQSHFPETNVIGRKLTMKWMAFGLALVAAVAGQAPSTRAAPLIFGTSLS